MQTGARLRFCFCLRLGHVDSRKTEVEVRLCHADRRSKTEVGSEVMACRQAQAVYFSIVFAVFLYWVIFLDFTYYTRMIRYMAGSGPLEVVDIRFAVGSPVWNSSPPPSGCLSS